MLVIGGYNGELEGGLECTYMDEILRFVPRPDSDVVK